MFTSMINHGKIQLDGQKALDVGTINIGLVMKLLNHSSEAMTLAYLGLDQVSREHMLGKIDFG